MIDFFTKILFYLSFVFLFFPIKSVCQEYQIQGNIKDLNGIKIINAKVFYISDISEGTFSDSSGRYFLNTKQKTGKLFVKFFDQISDTFLINFSTHNSITKDILLYNLPTKLLSDVVINVGKFDRPLEEQTVSLEIIRPSLIENKNTRSIETALDQTPGLNILDGEPQIRGGSGFTFGVGSKVAIIVDDMPMLSGDAGKPEWGFIPVENIHQIEITKGASSVLAGSSALSGSIHIRTAYPGNKPLTKATIYNGLYSKPLNKEASWSENPALISGASFLHSRKIKSLDFVLGLNLNYDHGYLGPPITDSLVEAFYPDTISNFTEKQMASSRARINFNLRKKSNKIKRLAYGLNGNFMYSKSNLVFAWLNDTSGIYRAYPGATFLVEQGIFNLDPFVQFINKKNGIHNLRTRYISTKNEMSASQSDENQTFYGDYSYKTTSKKHANLDFVGGLSGNYVNSFASIYSGGGSPKNTFSNVSIYSEIENKFFNILKLSVGARAEYFEINNSKNAFQPIFRGGLNLKIAKGSYLRSSFGQGYRFPTITERFIKTGVGNMGVFPNPDLKPEKSWNAELGIKQLLKFGTFFAQFDLAGFWQEYQNTIEYIFGIWNPLTTPQDLNKSAGFKFLNTGNSRVLGLDASLNGLLTIQKNASIVFQIGYNYILPTTLSPDLIYASDSLQRKFSYNSTSLDSTKHILKYRFLHNIKADMEVNLKEFSIGVSAKYFSKIENMDAVILDFEKMTQDVDVLQDIRYLDYYQANRRGIWVFDSRISYDYKAKHKLSLICTNLMNKMYSLRPLKIESPRIFMLQYSLKF